MVGTKSLSQYNSPTEIKAVNFDQPNSPKQSTSLCRIYMILTSPLTNAVFCRSAAAGPHDKLYTYASRIAYATHQRIVRHHLGSNKHLGPGGSYSPLNKYPPHPNKPGIPSESGLFVFRLVAWQREFPSPV